MRSSKFSTAVLSLALTALGMLSGSSAIAQEQASPTNAYLAYHEALMAASNVDGIQSMMAREVSDKIKATPKSMQPMYLNLIRSLSPRNVKVVNEQVDGENATLTLSSNSKDKTNGTVTLVREVEGWKINQETWQTAQK